MYKLYNPQPPPEISLAKIDEFKYIVLSYGVVQYNHFIDEIINRSLGEEGNLFIYANVNDRRNLDKFRGMEVDGFIDLVGIDIYSSWLNQLMVQAIKTNLFLLEKENLVHRYILEQR